jgi:methyl coenzyme M reductase beta subunit
MAAVAKSGTPSVSSDLVPQCNMTAGLLAGEAIAAGDACYIKSDGKIWLATGAAANAAARVVGFAAAAAAVGEAVTLYNDVNLRYGAGLTPGAVYYLSGTTAGALDTAASTGGTKPIAYAVDATRIHVHSSWRD